MLMQYQKDFHKKIHLSTDVLNPITILDFRSSLWIMKFLAPKIMISAKV